MTARASTVLALDFGGTKLAAGIPARQGYSWVVREQVETPRDGLSALSAMLKLANGITQDAIVKGVGVSFGGHLDGVTGVVSRSVQVPGWEGVRLVRILEGHFRAPVKVANDANAGALGEWHISSLGRGSTMAYLQASTGVGAGLVVGGKPIAGVDGLAGEVGHLVVDRDGEPCLCGRRGCVETIASGPAIARHAARLLTGTPPPRTGDEVSTLSLPLTAEDVAEAAAKGDPIALTVLAQAGQALAVAIGDIVTVFNPDVIAVGGGVTRAGAPLWDPLRDTLAREVWPVVTTEVRLARSLDAPLWGAAVLGQEASEECSALAAGST
jgi:glucokinase